jgi:hypothetical protein
MMASPGGRVADVGPIVQGLASQLQSTQALAEQASLASAFVLCFVRYATPTYLFELLMRELMKNRARLGILRLLFVWVKLRCKLDFLTSRASKRKLFHSLLDLVQQQRRSRLTEEELFEWNRILLLFVRFSEVHASRVVSRRALINGSKTRSPVIPMPTSGPEPTFWDHDPRSVAEQMTLIEANIFRALKPEEFYNKGWSDPARAPVLHMLVSRSNSISSWVASNILCQSSPSARSRALARFVVVGQYLEELGNYNALMSVLGGFHLWAITRLQAFIPLQQTYRLLLGRLEFVMSADGNYKAYRTTLVERAGKPLIPYLGLYLKDLTYIEDGNQDLVNDKPNAQKIQLFGTVLRDIEVFQRGCPEYNRKITARLPQLLDHLARFPRMTEEEMNNASLALRPSKVVTADSSSSEISVRPEGSTGSVGDSNSGSESSEMRQHLVGGDSGVSAVLKFLPIASQSSSQIQA